MADAAPTGRPNQRQRPRKDLLNAAVRLMSKGAKPSLEEVAEEALVSRATAYRYFPSIEALLLEAGLDVAFPDLASVFQDSPTGDPAERLVRAQSAVDQMIASNEPALRMMLMNSLQLSLREEKPGAARQNRRTPLIEAAIEPARRQLDPEALEHMKRALALVIGTEAMLVFKDVLQLSDEEARSTKRWAIRAFVDAARKR